MGLWAGHTSCYPIVTVTPLRLSARVLCPALSEDLDTLPSLVASAFTQVAQRPLLGPCGEALALALVAEEAGGHLKTVGDLPGLRRSLQGIFHAAGVAGLSPAQFQRLAERLDKGGAPLPRLVEVAALYGRYRTLLGSQLYDEASAFRKGVVHLANRAPFPQGSLVEVHGLDLCGEPAFSETVTRHGRLAACGALARNTPVRIALPEVGGKKTLEAALSPLQEALYRHHESGLEETRVPLIRPAHHQGPYGEFLSGLFAGKAPPCPQETLAPHLTFFCPPGRQAEARLVARQIRDLLDQGVPSSTIAVVAEGAPARARLKVALSRYDIPVRSVPSSGLPQGAESLLLAPPIQAFFALYERSEELAQRGIPREAFIELLETPYLHLAATNKTPWKVARALREAGIRDLRPGESAEHSRRIQEWASQLETQKRGGDPSLPPLLASVNQTLSLALALLGEIPHEAPLLTHLQKAHQLIDRLELLDRVRSCPPPIQRLSSLEGEHELFLEDALQRDQDAVAHLEQALADLHTASRRLLCQKVPLLRKRFVQLLRASFGRARVKSFCPSGVVLGDLPSLLGCGDPLGRPFAHLFVTGLVEGEFPAPRQEDSLLPDEIRRGLNRLLSQDVFPVSRSQDQSYPLWFVFLLQIGQVAHLFSPRADEDGRPLVRSPLFDEALRVSGFSEPERLRHQIIPELTEVRQRHELWSRALLEERRNPGPGPGGVRVPEGPLLSALLARDPDRGMRLLAILQIEEIRLRWFASLRLSQEKALAHLQSPFVGRLLDEDLRQRLSVKLPGSTAHPLSASALEDYARCPFRFFVRRVLKAEAAQEGGDDLDPLASGRLHHEVLDKFFRKRLEAGRLPLRGDDDDLASLDQVIEEVLATWPSRERMGHKQLFSVRVRRLRADLRLLILREAKKPVAPACVPRLFEHPFGPLSISSEAEHDGGMPLHIFGIIDRVDVGAGHAVVLDYKAGRLDKYEKILQKELLSTSFQLPLYAAALKIDPKLKDLGIVIDTVSARYYSLRAGRPSTAELVDQQMISLSRDDQARDPEHNVAEVAYRLWRKLRDGDFRVAPKTCEGCDLSFACRIALPEPEKPEEPEQPETPESSNSEGEEDKAPSTKTPSRSRAAA